MSDGNRGEHGDAPVTATVVAYRRVEQTLVTLRKLYECTPPPDEIIVHVDGNETRCAEAVQHVFPRVRLLLSRENVGPGGGRNKAIAAASHPVVASFDDDSFPIDVNYFERLRALVSRYPTAAVIAGRVLERGSILEPMEDGEEWVADFCGAGCAIRREAFLKTTGYVPLPLAYSMEEVDLALRLHAQGERILRATSLRVFHDTELSHHAEARVTAASIQNLALLAYLRYPRRLWIVGLVQCFNRVRWLLRHGRRAGIISGLLTIPATLARHRRHVARVSAESLLSYLKLRKYSNPVE